jgi:SAM-dependent methyltransferase
MTKIHPAALEGFSREARTYARGRPGYPADLLGWLQVELGLGPHKTVVDLGAGTGKATKLLLETGAVVTALEPVEAMREQLLQSLHVEALAGTAQDMPLDDGSMDAIVCAQAFHWFATHEALREIHRVLVPGGKLGLVWNTRDETCDWVAAITDIIRPYEGDAPRYYKGDWRQAFVGAPFSPLERTVFNYSHTGSAQEVIIDRTLSVSFIAALPAEQKEVVLNELNQLITTHPKLSGRAVIEFPYLTHAYRCVSLPPH